MSEVEIKPDERQLRASAEHSRGRMLALGTVFMILGVVALGSRYYVGVIAVYAVGLALFLGGVIELIEGFRRRREPHAMVLEGLLTTVVGGLVLSHPTAGVMAITLLLAGYLAVNGIFRGITALMERGQGWGWGLAYGIIATTLAGIIIARWSALSAFWIVGTLVGFELLVRGITIIGASSRSRVQVQRPA